MALGSIVIDLLMRTGAFEGDAKKAERRLQQLNKEAKQLGAVMGAAIAGGAAIATAAIKGAIDSMDELSKAAMRANMPTEEFSQLAYAGDLADVSVQDLTSSMGRLAKAQADALKDSSAQGRIFDALGISVKNADGQLRSTSDVFADFADRFQEMKGSPEIVAAGMNIFGRSFQSLIPLMVNGSQGLKDAADEADRLGITLSTKAGIEAEAFNDNLTRLQSAVTGLWRAVAADLLPDLVELTNRFVGATTEGDKLGETASKIAGVVRFMGQAFEFVYKPIQAVGDLIEGTAVQLEGLYQAAMGVITLDWDRIGRGMDLKNYGTQMALLGSDVANAGGARRPRLQLNIITPESILAEQRAAAEAEEAAFKASVEAAKAARDRQQRLAAALGGPEKAARGGRAAKPVKSEAEIEAERLASSYESMNEALQRSIILHGDTSNAARVSYEIQYGSLQNLEPKLRALVEEQAKWLGQLEDTAALEGVWDGVAQEQTSRLIDSWAEATDQLSVFAEQAARNMQDAFADFLFDPFKDGLGGMLKGFADILRRMAAEAAAAKVFESLGQYGQQNSGTWWGALLSSFSGTKKAGGGYISGPGTATSDSIPALLSNGEYVIKADAVSQYGRGFFESLNARRFASGGYVGGGAPAFAMGGGSMRVEIVNNGSPAKVESASMQQQPDGSQLIRMVLGAVADDVANGGRTASALKSRFDVRERV